ncbi:hypothetical protein CYR55_02860 [Chimaeribacter californicus]|uniref:Cellulose biosynthesis protein BcsR n=1 Tax=Chimaeribacter californicus TaxID=2060067 RepID=A0A2N5EGX2_9GAMM|nr:cellulose biosynthesis protein BcsR [Chimaeribacter californicus]PLR41780.1 hypothetical protein CYR55_02860 [Chimaeribacter californicus]
MDNKHQLTFQPEAPAISDDFYVLRKTFEIPAFRYIDISRASRIPALLARWPLLGELSAQPASVTSAAPHAGDGESA